MGAHLPALQVIIPLLAAPLCVLVRGARAAWLVAVAASWSALAVAVCLLQRVLASGEPISYHLGGHAPPHGIELRVDALNAFVLLIVTGVSAVVVSASRGSLKSEMAPERHYLYFAATLLCMTGLLGMIYGSWAKAVPGDPSLGGGDYSQLEEYAAAARKFWPGN